VAHSNRHPGGGQGTGFRGMTAPRYFEVLRQRRETGRRLGLLCQDYVGKVARAGGASSIRMTVGEMVDEMVPFAKQIGMPQDVREGIGVSMYEGWGGGEVGGLSIDRRGREDGESSSCEASLASALSFLRLFNQRLCPFEPVDGPDGDGEERLGAQPSDLDVDDIQE